VIEQDAGLGRAAAAELEQQRLRAADGRHLDRVLAEIASSVRVG
jgi:hypothetical protein